MITHKQLTLAEVFEDCQNKFDNDCLKFYHIFDICSTYFRQHFHYRHSVLCT